MHVTCRRCDKESELGEKDAAKLKEQVRAELENEYEEKLLREKGAIELAAQKNAERAKLQLRTLEEQLEQVRASLSEALSRAASGNNQQKGEALELTLEEELREAFPCDKIDEVKKGASGADISHSVRDSSAKACGTILYECKNAKWKVSWIEKIKSDARAAKADIGIVVSLDFPSEWGDFHQVEGHIWVVKPRLAVNFAAALRHMLVMLATISRNNLLKEERMQFIHDYFTGPEFRSRIESVIEGCNILQREIEKERRAAQLRWSHQEHAIRMMTDNTFGLHGDVEAMLAARMQPSLPARKGKKGGGAPRDIEELFDEVEFGGEAEGR